MTLPLHTIGYEGSSIEDFLATLSIAGIDLVIDVRDVPLSRKKGFSKNALRQQLAGYGIDYQHLKALGDPKEGRIAARERRFDDFRQIYGEHLRTDEAQNAVDAAVTMANAQRACLLCFERDHHECHRLAVAIEMAKRADFRLIHIGVKRGVAPIRGENAKHGDFAFVG
ncbi:hypothetical protein ARD30_04810 [Bosea thiooxidans]|uniref:DUF488 domain-containing protein n=1 Tax=Bosea thiooxidans TaxID=53254 RepID=A0A0Q3KLZ1_9HYPH|nr:DUF488 domain-containing protein [Bosea thiooxidans]KQK30635.1 hypothetical protein ARD30_04810 [Bosea thiooxidans]